MAEQQATTITTIEHLESGYSKYTWPCAPLLAHYVYSQRDMLQGARVLELGAGTGAPGIVAAKCGAHVTLTDRTASSHDQLTAACRLNGVADSVRVMGISWGLFSQNMLDIGQYDIILASDCLYDSQVFEDMLATIYFVMRSSKDAKCWMSYQDRSSNRSLLPLLERWGLACQQLHCTPNIEQLVISGPPRQQLTASSPPDIHLWEITSNNYS